MKSLRIIFPDQLSKNNPVLIDIDTNDFLLFYEPIDTFYEIKHHKHKLVLLLSAFRTLVSKQAHKNSNFAVVSPKLNGSAQIFVHFWKSNVFRTNKQNG